MDNRGQGAFEYILLLAGILLIVILVIVILRSSVLSQANAQITSNVNTFTSLTNCTTIGYNASTNTSTITCGGQNFTV